MKVEKALLMELELVSFQSVQIDLHINITLLSRRSTLGILSKLINLRINIKNPVILSIN